MIISLWILIFVANSCFAQSNNGFNLEDALIPVDKIFSGGPGKDGIPAIDKPRFIAADKVSFLGDDAGVIGIHYKGISKAYPINVLNWHEIVNDQFNDEPIVITFCPLCGSGMAFSAKINGKAHTFGVSGLLYNSDVLLYDRQTQSLWSQLMTQAISGEHKGQKLVGLPVLHTTWQDWKAKYPDSLVLSNETGFNRDYKASPYAAYIKSPQTMFPISNVSRLYHPKEDVLGVEVNGLFKVYPFIELEKSSEEFTDIFNGGVLTIRYDNKHRSAAVFDAQGRQLVSVKTYWFAWYAFHPKTEVYIASKAQ
ncbi:MAG: DUF3179 domain-containing protein [Methyloprofundus sp.]|nr:DUF3179 domain-containing protein [Methyloprofundus sp.]MDT8426130.1 DUF3179 domain-containing protein [Methyloprofundus sp.]